MTECHRRVVDRHAGGEKRRRRVGGLQRVVDQAHVFLPDGDLHRGFIPGAVNHHWAAHLKHARTARTVGDDAHHVGRIQTRAHSHQDRFGGRHVVYRHQQIGNQFHPHAIAERADVVTHPRKTFEDRPESADAFCVTAGINRQIARQCLRARARQRAVEQRNFVLSQRSKRAHLRSFGQRAGFGDDQSLDAGSDQFVAHRVEHCLARQRQHDEATLPRDFGRAGAGLATGFFQAGAGLGHRVVSEDGEARLDEVGRHRRAHDAQADDPDSARAGGGLNACFCRGAFKRFGFGCCHSGLNRKQGRMRGALNCR